MTIEFTGLETLSEVCDELDQAYYSDEPIHPTLRAECTNNWIGRLYALVALGQLYQSLANQDAAWDSIIGDQAARFEAHVERVGRIR